MHSGLRLDSDGIVRPKDDRHGIEHDGLVVDLDAALEYCRARDVAVQAGGCFGVWPLYLARLFMHVYTFEPDWQNFRCLTINIAEAGGGVSNVIPIRSALSDKSGFASIRRAQQSNAGSGYLTEGNEFPKIPLDSLCLPACDLICLDVEGSELDALKGAEVTIQKHKPVVMLEAKQLEHMAAGRFEAVEWLQSLGYELRRKVHKDLILTARTQ